MSMPATRRGRPPPLRWWREFLELLFPTHCVGCGEAGTIWCPGCQARLVPVSDPICLACRRPVRTQESHHACPPDALRAWAADSYRPPLDRALTHLKYRPDARLIQHLAGELELAYQRAGIATTCIVPVPLGPRRQRRRGYNQSELLGRALAESLDLPFHPSAAFRIRETPSQVGLDPQARWANVDGAFQADPSLICGHVVLLIDDVHTTGATLAACAAALSGAGAQRVFGLTVGRA